MSTLTLSLISHTNVGKTTLARTLTRRDVGEVFDQAHVTEVSEAYTLLDGEAGELRLWDTPGLGDTVRLVRRLKKSGNPIGWFLHEVWDRNLDRPLWCSQEALRNVREDADCVLYIINAAETPEDAGYVGLELDILKWIGRPTLAVLNQTGSVSGSSEKIEAEWRDYLRQHTIVRDVLSLDAFGRCWVQEDLLFDRVAQVLDGDQRQTMEALAEAWHQQNAEIFDRSMKLIAEELASTATDRETLPSVFPNNAQKEEAMAALGKRFETREEKLWDAVIAAHGLEGKLANEAKQQIDSFCVMGEEALSPQKGAILGSMVSGALGGLTADIMSGGLSFGGGLLAGTILGALGGAGLSHAMRFLKTGEEPTVTWSRELLDGLVERLILRYLAIAHFGRGRGSFEEDETPSDWTQSVRATLAAHKPRFAAHWDAAESSPSPARIAQILNKDLRKAVVSILNHAYPESKLR